MSLLLLRSLRRHRIEVPLVFLVASDHHLRLSVRLYISLEERCVRRCGQRMHQVLRKDAP